MRVLVVEGGAMPARRIRHAVRAGGEAADIAMCGGDALWMAAATDYDVIAMDVKLPGIDGFETCRRLREDGVLTPILLLSDRDAVADRIAGLDGGADDYIVEPVDLDEFLARLRALARRGAVRHLPVLEVGSLRLDPASRRVWRGKVEIELSTKEFGLLEVFMRNPDAVLDRLDLLDGAWDNGYENHSNVISVHIHRLRTKIDRPFGTESIETIRGAGYRLRPSTG